MIRKAIWSLPIASALENSAVLPALPPSNWNDERLSVIKAESGAGLIPATLRVAPIQRCWRASGSRAAGATVAGAVAAGVGDGVTPVPGGRPRTSTVAPATASTTAAAEANFTF